jgi:predicted metal-binding protein
MMPDPPPDQGLNCRPAAPVTVSVCITCKTADVPDESRLGSLMLSAVRAVLDSFAPQVLVRPVRCLGVCKRPATVAVSAADGYTFVFGDLERETGAAALATFIRSYQAVDYGFVPWRERPEILRRSLVARIPSAAWSPDDGRPPA